MKKCLSLLVLLSLFYLDTGVLQTQTTSGYNYQLPVTTYTAITNCLVSSNTGLCAGYNISGSGAQFHQLVINTKGTVTTCAVSVDSSVDGITWTLANIIASQNCGGNTNIFITSSSFVVNFIRVNVTTLTGGGSISVLLTGYSNQISSIGTTLGQPVIGGSGGTAVASPAQLYVSAFTGSDGGVKLTTAFASCVPSVTLSAGKGGCYMQYDIPGISVWANESLSTLAGEVNFCNAGNTDIRVLVTQVIPSLLRVFGCGISSPQEDNGNYGNTIFRAANPAFMSGSTFGTAIAPFTDPNNSPLLIGMSSAISVAAGVMTVTTPVQSTLLKVGSEVVMYDGTDAAAVTGHLMVTTAPSSTSFTVNVDTRLNGLTCASNCGLVYNAFPVFRFQNTSAFRAELAYLSVDCAYVRGAIGVVNTTAEEQSTVHDIHIYNCGTEGLRVGLNSLNRAFGGSTSGNYLGAINSGPYNQMSVQILKESCELNNQCPLTTIASINNATSALTVPTNGSTAAFTGTMVTNTVLVGVGANVLATTVNAMVSPWQVTLAATWPFTSAAGNATVNYSSVVSTTGTINLNSNALSTSENNFTSTMVGAMISVNVGANVDSTTIATFVDAKHVTLTANWTFANTSAASVTLGHTNGPTNNSFDPSTDMPQVLNCSTFAFLLEGNKVADVRGFYHATIQFVSGGAIAQQLTTKGWLNSGVSASCSTIAQGGATNNAPGAGSAIGHFLYGATTHASDNHTEYVPTAYCIGCQDVNAYWQGQQNANGANAQNIVVENEETCTWGGCSGSYGTATIYAIDIGSNTSDIIIRNINFTTNAGLHDGVHGVNCTDNQITEYRVTHGPAGALTPAGLHTDCSGIPNIFENSLDLSTFGLLSEQTTADASYTVGLSACVTANNTVGNCPSVAASQALLGVLVAKNGTRPVWATQGNVNVSNNGAGQSWGVKDFVCTDPVNAGFFVDNGTVPCGWNSRLVGTALTGGTINTSHLISLNIAGSGILVGTTAAFATATTAGTCATSAGLTITGATTAMSCSASPVSDPGAGSQWSCFVSGANTITVRECAVAASAGGTIAFNVRLIL